MSNRRVVLYLAGLVGLLSPVYAATDAVNSLLSTGFFGTTTVSFIVVLLTFSVIVYLLLITLNPAERIRGNGGENEEGEDKVYRMISGLVGFIFAYTFWKYGLLDNFFATLILGGLIALAVLFVRRHEELNKFEVGFALMLIGYLAVWKFNIFSTWGSLAFWIGLGLIGWGGWSKIKGGTPGAVGWFKNKRKDIANLKTDGKHEGNEINTNIRDSEEEVEHEHKQIEAITTDTQEQINEVTKVESKVESADRTIFGIAKDLKKSFRTYLKLGPHSGYTEEAKIGNHITRDIKALSKLGVGEEEAEEFLLSKNEKIIKYLYSEIKLEIKKNKDIIKESYQLNKTLGDKGSSIISRLHYEGNNDKKLEYYTEWILHLEINFKDYLKAITAIRKGIINQTKIVLKVNIGNVESIQSAIAALEAIEGEEVKIDVLENKIGKKDLEAIQKTNNIIRELSKVDAFVKKS